MIKLVIMFLIRVIAYNRIGDFCPIEVHELADVCILQVVLNQCFVILSYFSIDDQDLIINLISAYSVCLQ